MQPHRFDALSAALGVLCLAAAGAVATNALLTTDTYLAGWWFALGALVLGLGLLPWPSRRDTPFRTEERADSGAPVSAEPLLPGPEEDPFEGVEER